MAEPQPRHPQQRTKNLNPKGKVAFVTGGNSGIGSAIVLELARPGANLELDGVTHPEATAELEKQVQALVAPLVGCRSCTPALAAGSESLRAGRWTQPILNPFRRSSQVVTGAEKIEMHSRLPNADVSIPARRIHQDAAPGRADRPAAGRGCNFRTATILILNISIRGAS
jgi:NAD(P)-dependent dehydrogenase (short-subunit alcohol dehydrogenase family)